jgi:hypothetical protein
MAFFGNDAVNRVNLHYSLVALAQASGGVFVSAYLIRAGVPVPFAFLTPAAILTGRFVIRPATLPLAKRWGLKPLVIVGALIVAAQYPLISLIHGVGPALAAFCAVAAVGDVFYWVGYNSYFAALGDAEHRGHQVSIREAFVAGAAIAGPLAAGVALTAFGPGPAFMAVGLIQAASILPLLSVPNVAVKAQAPGAFRAATLGGVLAACDGWFDAWHLITWQIALFLALGQSYEAFGGAMALAAAVGAACGLLLGRHLDAGHGRRVVAIAYGVAAVVTLARAASGGVPWVMVAANTAGPFSMTLLATAAASAGYNLAKASPCVLRFHLVTEATWDMGCAAACVTAAALAAIKVPLYLTVPLALPPMALAAFLLRRYYGGGFRTPAAEGA